MFTKMSDRFHKGTATEKLPARKEVKVGVLGLCLLPLATLVLPVLSDPALAFAKKNNPYNQCAADLLSRELSPETVALACASVVRPGDLASCVVEIDQQTDIIPLDALNTCRGVRRPTELANCVVDIAQLSAEGDGPAILEFCRRSLLPQEFSECVVGLKNQIDLITPQAMVVCIDAGDRVIDPGPNFIPGSQGPVIPPQPDLDLPST